ncbi:MAG: hypothetical protein AB7P76_11315 [Candidatus Melainabacteria bacterium]
MFSYNRLFSLFLLLLLFLGGVGAQSGLVMCYGADGHVAIEVGGSDCNDTPQQIDNSHGHQEALVNQTHCGNCTDIPLMFQATEPVSSEQASLSLDLKPIYLMASWEVHPSLFLETATEGQLPQPPPILDPVLKVRRTVVLLI